MHADLDDLARLATFPAADRFELDGRASRSGGRGRLFDLPHLPSIVADAAQAIYDRYYVRPGPPALAFFDLAGADEFLTDLQHASRAAHLTAPIGGSYAYLGGARAPPPDAPLARFYWALAACGARSFVAALPAALERAQVPFRAKVLRDPVAFRRADSAVVYVPASAAEAAWAAQREVWLDLEMYLGPDPPRFTHRLAPGVGFAMDPGGGHSFGTRMCALAAEALWRAGPGAPVAARATALARHLRAHAIDPDAPHLGVETVAA